MARILPTKITHPYRNKVCIFPTEEACDMSSSDVNSIIRRNPYSFNNILYKPYIKRLEGIKKYNAIRRQYLKFKKNKIIRVDENPSYFIYNIIDNEKNEFEGIIAKIPHAEFVSEQVIKMEKSDPDVVEEKYHMLKNTGFVSKPITVLHDEIPAIDEIIAKYKSKIPLYEFTRNNGFIHEVWQILDPEDIAVIKAAYDQTKRFYIVDDNDRFEALHRIYREQTDLYQDTHTGLEAYNFFPAFLISKNQAKIHEYKKGIPPDYPKKLHEVLAILQKDFDYEEIFDYNQPEKGEILLYSLGGKFKLKPKQHIPAGLPDAVVFERYILPAMSSENKLLQANSLKYCSGNRSTKCVENHLNKGNCKFGFIIKPIDFEGIKKTAEQKIKIPYKSIYIEPRLLRGLFIYEI